MKCGYDSIIGDIYRELSDQQGLVWAASTALFPRSKANSSCIICCFTMWANGLLYV